VRPPTDDGRRAAGSRNVRATDEPTATSRPRAQMARRGGFPGGGDGSRQATQVSTHACELEQVCRDRRANAQGQGAARPPGPIIHETTHVSAKDRPEQMLPSLKDQRVCTLSCRGTYSQVLFLVFLVAQRTL